MNGKINSMSLKQKRYYDFYDLLDELDSKSIDYENNKRILYSLIEDSFCGESVSIDLKDVEKNPNDFISEYVEAIKLLRKLGIKQNEITIAR